MQILDLLPDHYVERAYFRAMLAELDEEALAGRTVVLTCDYGSIPVRGEDVVVIVTSGAGETVHPPAYHADVGLVFKHQLDAERVGNVHHIPLTYVHDFPGDARIPIAERRYDVFFAGSRANRGRFERELESLKEHRRDLAVFSLFYGGFMTGGLEGREYAARMMDAKIVLSPHGQVRCECFRFTEAVKCGAAIIAPVHPRCAAFDECPAAYCAGWKGMGEELDRSCPGWEELSERVDFCLENLASIHEGMKRSWERHFSPAAVARYIQRRIEASDPPGEDPA